MNIQQLASKNMPGWAGAVLAIGGLLSGAGVMWTQIEETFPALFADENNYYEEYANHFGEEPFQTNTLEYPGVGVITTSFYESDGCFLIQAPGRDPYWLTRDAIGLGPDGSVRRPPIALAGFGLFDEEPCLTVGCRNPHRGEFETHVGDTETIDGIAWTRIHRVFEDGCEHYQLRRDADGQWHDDEEGIPIVCWIDCRHEGEPDGEDQR